MRPVQRPLVRIAAGKIYYTAKRYLEWYLGEQQFSKTISNSLLPQAVFAHSTPLLRKLKGVEMWLQLNKVTNLKMAVQRINGIIVKPGETFSFWRLVGKPTRSKGYVDGMVLFCGGFKPGTGGGLCQLSNLIYWMTLHTPLMVTERHRHSYDVFPDADRTQPFGSGATVFYNYLDLQILNESDQSYQLHVYLTDEELVGEWRSLNQPLETYEVYQKRHWITHEYWGGYVRHNTIFRRIYNLEKELIDDRYLTENHAIMMYQPFLPE